MIPAFQELLTVRSEDIGDFKPMLRHRTRHPNWSVLRVRGRDVRQRPRFGLQLDAKPPVWEGRCR